MMDLRLNTYYIEGEEAFELIVDEDGPRTDYPVSSVRLWRADATHTRLRFWNRGASTSSNWIVVRTADALEITARLFGLSLREFATVVTENMRSSFRTTKREDT